MLPPQLNMTIRHRVLLVEDEEPIREVVRLHLDLAGFDVTEVGNGRRALDLARDTRFDVLILDVMLPGLDGVTLCRALRSEGANTLTPILMVTARDAESDKVLGLESGADDYLTKPFGTRELVARVHALLRHQNRLTSQPEPSARLLSRRHIEMDLDRRQVSVRGTVVELTKQEFDVLQALIAHPGIVFSREALLTKVWGGDTYVTDRTVDAVVSRLRRKIEADPQDPEMLLTAWGVGYKFVDAG